MKHFFFIVPILLFSIPPLFGMEPKPQANDTFLKAALESNSLSEFMELYRQAVEEEKQDEEEQEQSGAQEPTDHSNLPCSPTMIQLLGQCIQRK